MAASGLFPEGGCRFWLPAGFLSSGEEEEDDNILLGDRVGQPQQQPVVASPNDSSDEEVAGDDADDYLAGLTREMAHFFLLDDDDGKLPVTTNTARDNTNKDVPGSPQSTLCDCLSPEKSPAPATAGEGDEWDLLYDYEVAGEMNKPQEHRKVPTIPATKKQQHHQPRHPLPPPAGTKNHKGTGYFVDPAAAAQRQLQIAQFHALRQQQILKQQQLAAMWAKQNRARGGAGGVGGVGQSAMPAPATWTPVQKQQPVQQQQESGMRAVFLTGGAKKESAGTGVFLPRRPGTPNSDTKKKPGCSVLLPAKVVQALNLNLDELNGPNPRNVPDAHVGRSNAKRGNGNGNHHHHHHLHQHRSQQQQELRLPPEWTY